MQRADHNEATAHQPPVKPAPRRQTVNARTKEVRV